MRLGIIILLVVVALIGGPAIYYDHSIDRKLEESYHLMPQGVREAYETFRPIIGYNNLLSFGEARRARFEFQEYLHGYILHELHPGTWVPRADAFRQMRDALYIFDDIETLSGDDLSGYKAGLLQEARAAAAQVRQHGTIPAWEAIIDTFETLNAEDMLQPGVFQDFEAWLAEARAMPQDVLALRDARAQARQQFQRAMLLLDPSPENEQDIAVPLTGYYSEEELFDVWRVLRHGIKPIDDYTREYQHGRLTPELMGIKAILLYNSAVIKLHHLMQQGSYARFMGSGFMAEIYLLPHAVALPTAQEMYASFTISTWADFEESYNLLIQSELDWTDDKSLLLALILWARGLLSDYMGEDSTALKRVARQQAEAIPTAEERAFFDRVTRMDRPMLITRLTARYPR